MELRKNFKKICKHRIELMASVQSIRQTQYWMNPNYALKVGKDLFTLSKQHHGKKSKELW